MSRAKFRSGLQDQRNSTLNRADKALDSNRTTDSRPDLLHPQQIDFKNLVNLSEDAVVLLGLDGVPAYVSPACERMLGWTASRILEAGGELVQVTAGDRDSELLSRIFNGNSESAGSLPRGEVQLRAASGSLLWTEAVTHLLRDGTGAAYAIAIYLRDISRRKELESLLEAANQTDPQTGLLYGRAFEEALKREWAIALREKTHTSLIKVSLDRFDLLSATLSPGIATEYLSKVSRTLLETARRPADITARTGPYEFSLLLPRTHELGAETISAYILVAIKDLAIPDPDNSAGDGVMSASIGAACAVAEQTGITLGADFIVASTETCLQQARDAGGNIVKTVVEYLER